MKWTWPAGLAAAATGLFAAVVPLSFAMGAKPTPDSWADLGLAGVIWSYLTVTPLAGLLAVMLGAYRDRSGRWVVALLVLWLLVVLGLGAINLR